MRDKAQSRQALGKGRRGKPLLRAGIKLLVRAAMKL